MARDPLSSMKMFFFFPFFFKSAVATVMIHRLEIQIRLITVIINTF